MIKQLISPAFLMVCLAGLTSACSNPQVLTKYFTTTDATIVAHIGFIAEFEVKCSSGEVPNLYAELEDGSIVPVAIVGPHSYQVSWTEDSKTAKKGQHNVRIFNEEGYAALRKAIRNNDGVHSVPEFFNVSVYHPGAYSGPWLRSEFVAVLISLFISYFAITTKAKIVF